MAQMRTNISTSVIEISCPSRHLADGDQRSIPRLLLRYAVSLSRPGEASRVVTETEDINCKGFYCFSERRFLPHETLNCEMVISLGLRGDHLVLHAEVEVLRV